MEYTSRIAFESIGNIHCQSQPPQGSHGYSDSSRKPGLLQSEPGFLCFRPAAHHAPHFCTGNPADPVKESVSELTTVPKALGMRACRKKDPRARHLVFAHTDTVSGVDSRIWRGDMLV